MDATQNNEVASLEDWGPNEILHRGILLLTLSRKTL